MDGLERCFVLFVLFQAAGLVGAEPQFIMSDRQNVYILDTETNNLTTIATGYQWIMFLDFHKKEKTIFWSDYMGNTISRVSFPVASTPQVILAARQSPRGVAVDEINDKLYWTEGSNKLYRSNLDGTNTVIILENLIEPRDIRVDPQNRWLYVINLRINVQRCRFDGSELQTVVEVNLGVTFLLELTENRIYWCEWDLRRVFSAQLSDGSDKKEVINAWSYTDELYGIELDQNYIYYAEYYRGYLYRKPRYNLTAKYEQIYKGGISYIKLWDNIDNKCSNHSVISNEERRSTGYNVTDKVPVVYSDHLLPEGWYRVESDNGENMPTSPPGVNRCGTRFPIWINGSLPDSSERNKTVTACVETDEDACLETFEIEVTNCGQFNVYYLKPTAENSSYCFGSGLVLCPNGLSSESGYYPGCSSSFPNRTVSPVVQATIVVTTKHTSGYDFNVVQPVFKCAFDTADESILYDVYWYINENCVKVTKNVDFSNMMTTNLKASDWVFQYHLNMEVRCSVRLRFSENSLPSPFYTSNEFQAGLFPEKYEYTVVEGEQIGITLTPTVFVGCLTNDSSHRKQQCDQIIKTSVPDTDNSELVCSNSRDIVFGQQQCGVVLKSTDILEDVAIQVVGYIDGIYNLNERSTYIKLSTFSTVANPSFEYDIWTNFSMNEIKVNVLDKDKTLSGRVCQSYNDPHFRTFDGLTYHYMEVGEFVLYKNEKGPYWVHALYSNCGFGWTGSSCNCGVAIRSRNSLYVVRTCKRVSRTDTEFLVQPHIELKKCNDNDIDVEVSGSKYTAKLPIGTEIQFSLRGSNFISSISIKPSVYDIHEAQGLCGVPSQNPDTADDFTNRDTGEVSGETAFADSWRVSSTRHSNEQLFVDNPSYPIVVDSNESGETEITNRTLKRYCTCTRQLGSVGNFENFNDYQCNLTEATSQCSSQPQTNYGGGSGAVQTGCPAYNRRKRSAEHHRYKRSLDNTDDVLETQPLEVDDGVESNGTIQEQLQFRNGWTMESANQTCHERLTNGIPDELEWVSMTDYIESCILDIQITANTDFLEDTVSTMQTYTIMEVLRNETFLNTTTEDGSQTILQYVTSFLCPRNCSERGNCTLGKCSCFEGFIGDDCSGNKTQLLTDVRVPNSGLCGTRSRQCTQTNIYGNFPSPNVWCKRQHFRIFIGDVVYDNSSSIVKATYRNQFMVTVDFQTSRRKKRSTGTPAMAEGYDLSLSNDGVNFGDSVQIIVYDEECKSCNSSTLVCVELPSCPDLTTESVTTAGQTTISVQEHVSTTQEPTTTILLSSETTEQSTTLKPTSTEQQLTTTEETTSETTTLSTTKQATTTKQQRTTTEDIISQGTTTSLRSTIEDRSTFRTTPRQTTTEPSKTTSDDITPSTTRQHSTTEDKTTTNEKFTTKEQMTSQGIVSQQTTEEQHTTTTQTESILDSLRSYIGPLVIGSCVALVCLIFLLLFIVIRCKRSAKRSQDSDSSDMSSSDSYFQHSTRKSKARKMPSKAEPRPDYDEPHRSTGRNMSKDLQPDYIMYDQSRRYNPLKLSKDFETFPDYSQSRHFNPSSFTNRGYRHENKTFFY